MTRFFRLIFWAAALLALIMALLPKPPALPGDPSDKLQHILAFFTLAVLARLAYPQRSSLWLLGALALFGAVIELGQLIPGLNRDGDIVDWIADVVAAALGLAAAGVLRRVLLSG